MADEIYGIRPRMRASALDAMREIVLTKNDRGLYDFDGAIKYCASVKQFLASVYNPKNSQGDGMIALAQPGSTLSKVTSKTIATFESVLKQYADKAAAASTATQTVAPLITEHGPAQDEADRNNSFYQSVLGTKEGVAMGIAKQVGSHITDPVLRKAGSSDMKQIDDYQLSDLLDAVKAGAQRPSATDILSQLLEVVRFPFDFQHKASTNMELLRDRIARLAAFGITIDDTQIALVILANVECAAKHPWGTEYKYARDTLGRKYQYNHVHDDTSIKDILKVLEEADKARVLSDAPAPHDSSMEGVAQAVNEAVSAFNSYYQEDYASESETEGIAAAVQSDSESSGGNTRNTSTSRRGRGRSRSRARSTTRDNFRDNPCPHCRKYRRHRKHPNISTNECYWNPKYTGYRPRAVCDEMEIDFVPHWKIEEREEKRNNKQRDE
jgi:hypothetical protein